MSEQLTSSPGSRRAPFVAAMRPARGLLLAAVITAAASGLCTLGALWFIVRLVGESSARIAVGACAAWLAGAAFAAVSSWLAHHAETRFAARLRRDVATHLAHLPMRTLSRYGGEELRRLVGDDIAALHNVVAHLPMEIATLALVPLATVVLLVSTAGPQALLALIPGLLAALYYLVVVPRTSARHGTRSAQVMNEIVTAVDDYTNGIRTCRMYSAQAGAVAEYGAATKRFTDGMLSWVTQVATIGALAVAALQAVATYAIAYALGYQRSAEVLAAMLLFGLAIVTPALRLGHGLDYVRSGQAAAKRITGVLQERPVQVTRLRCDGAAGACLELVGAELRTGDRVLLPTFSHAFPGSSLTAISGPSGSGKSTLLRAVAGLDELTSGLIALPGDGGTFLVPQGADVLPGTVAENIALGAPDASDARLTEALHRAGLQIDLRADTVNLSGGEKQRVGLARAFLTQAPVILLDEPTSALDGEKSREVLTHLRRLAHAEDKTVLVVTHDPLVVAAADHHVTIAQGGIAQAGGNP
ncbi:ATP-binding cassette domain-containing protein [Gephyromycinifex aptenodytis]|uniref:ATP-binding cassette domain-containing protein n=1 Tax=Gephyromycinifex aptenodytis TaxID=2716227 RepID=UPI001446A76C|nr:ABC transporter ATP-binding protein [Gephyromycinifex aptenodytis]